MKLMCLTILSLISIINWVVKLLVQAVLNNSSKQLEAMPASRRKSLAFKRRNQSINASDILIRLSNYIGMYLDHFITLTKIKTLRIIYIYKCDLIDILT